MYLYPISHVQEVFAEFGFLRWVSPLNPGITNNRMNVNSAQIVGGQDFTWAVLQQISAYLLWYILKLLLIDQNTFLTSFGQIPSFEAIHFRIFCDKFALNTLKNLRRFACVVGVFQFWVFQDLAKTRWKERNARFTIWTLIARPEFGLLTELALLDVPWRRKLSGK